ncbi:ABC transporter permease subunit [Lacticaseibacillus manihotivorans]|jgi:sulfonate transport system permease protein|uniref:ABC transporter permease n=2 Tax=Lacticaseibacillus manihotivorans TaxID=88233 RepID=A0A0R1R8W0_9LACO|nr:ABC transporter permease subunit [Lacticaseibacillus manihotivorans]KRL53597.1 ABC transporter permease [Lacticaseibacillus manihotivorans DSM 13343 = JCM 12514]QFQ90406.1 ABC transporter permease subunit [Lacticaseibacillus manihotivorans]
MDNATDLTHNTKQPRAYSFKQLLPWLIPVGLIIIWQIAGTLGWISTKLLPTPWSVIQDGVSLWQSGELQKNMGISLYRALVGFAIGGSVGFFFGMLNGLSKTARALFDSTIQMLRNIPHLSLIPVVIILFGIGETAKISLVTVGVMFPIYINTFHGITSVDPELIEMGQAYGLSKREMLTKIVFPGALPTILVGVRYALGVMWTTLIVAETISSTSGIGYMATNAQEFMNMKTVLLCIVIYALLGKVSDLIAKLLEDICLDWQAERSR